MLITTKVFKLHNEMAKHKKMTQQPFIHIFRIHKNIGEKQNLFACIGSWEGHNRTNIYTAINNNIHSVIPQMGYGEGNAYVDLNPTLGGREVSYRPLTKGKT